MTVSSSGAKATLQKSRTVGRLKMHSRIQLESQTGVGWYSGILEKLFALLCLLKNNTAADLKKSTPTGALFFVFILFFKKIEKILYIKLYEYLQSISDEYEYDEDTGSYRHKQHYEYEEPKKEQDERLKLACQMFSININKLSEITQDELKQKYHKLARMFHPDFHKEKKEQMDTKMKEINNTYEFLKQHIGA